MGQIRFVAFTSAILLLAGVAWGQITPQDESSLPPQTEASMPSLDQDDEDNKHTIHGVSRRGYNVFNPRDRALLRFFYYRQLLEQEREEIEAAKEELRAQEEERETQDAAQAEQVRYEPPTVIREYRIFQSPIQLDPYMVQRVLQRRAEQERAAQEGISEVTPVEKAPIPTPTPTPVRLRSASEILYDQGKTAFQSRNYFNAMKTFEQLNQAAPNNPHIEFAHGLSLFAFSQFEQASEILPKVIDEAKRSDVELPEITEFYSNERDYLSHRAALKRRLDENPDDAALSALYLSLPSKFIEEVVE